MSVPLKWNIQSHTPTHTKGLFLSEVTAAQGYFWFLQSHISTKGFQLGSCRFLKIMGCFSHSPWPPQVAPKQISSRSTHCKGTELHPWGVSHKSIRFSKFQVHCAAPVPSPTFQLASQRCWEWRDWTEVVGMNVVRGKQQRDRKHENIHGQHETTLLSTWKHLTCTEILLSTSMHSSKGKRKKWD